jgi:ABC-type phosphate transport system substrate-binding protein
LASNSVDLAFTETYQTTADIINTPDMVSIPLAAQALVMVYNLPGITEGSLTLSMQLVARIFLGSITKWNDPSIVALNTGVLLPNVNITLVVRDDLILESLVFDQGMRSTSSDWASKVPSVTNGVVQWPYTSGQFLRRRDRFSQATAMATQPYALSYMWLDAANDLGIPYVNFMGSNGVILDPTGDGILFAVIEKGGPGTFTPITNLLDLTVPSNPYAWPLASYSWMVIRKLAFRQTCAINAETLKFILWFYTSTPAATLATTLSFTIPPSQIIAQHKVLVLINSEIFCAGDLVLPVSNAETSTGVGSELAVNLLSLFPAVYQSSSTVNGTVEFSQDESSNAIERLMWGEVDFAVECASSMSQNELEMTLESNEVIQLPLFASRFVMIHSLSTISSDDDDGLILDFNTLSDIWQGIHCLHVPHLCITTVLTI